MGPLATIIAAIAACTLFGSLCEAQTITATEDAGAVTVTIPDAFKILINKKRGFGARIYDLRNSPDYNLGGAWMAAESIHTLLFDMFGSYHGNESNALTLTETLPSKRANIGYYDGHVDSYQDPLPYRTASVDLLSLLLNHLTSERLQKITAPVMLQIYAQRGVAMTMDLLVTILASLIT